MYVQLCVCTWLCASPRVCPLVATSSASGSGGGARAGDGWARGGRACACSLTAGLCPHSCEERSQQEEEGGAQARVLRGPHADARGGGAHREGAQSAPGDLPCPLPAGQVHYGTASPGLMGGGVRPVPRMAPHRVLRPGRLLLTLARLPRPPFPSSPSSCFLLSRSSQEVKARFGAGLWGLVEPGQEGLP